FFNSIFLSRFSVPLLLTPHKEREARKNARQAGQVASTIGGIAGTVAAVAIGGTAAVGAAIAAPAVLGLAAAITVHQLSKGDD
ncbi:MAG: hypothetical protein ACRAVC_22385, partial [Trichormus sp.]